MGAPKKLFSFTVREEAHQKLEEVRASTHPDAECRDDINDEVEPFQVWSGPEPRSRG